MSHSTPSPTTPTHPTSGPGSATTLSATTLSAALLSAAPSPALKASEENAIDETSVKWAVSCRGLIKEFGAGDAKTIALRGIDLDLPHGELALLVGESGCGKTTLISLIAGLLNPTAGTVRVFDMDLPRLSSTQLSDFRARHIGFVFQQYNLLPTLTAVENVAVPLLILGQPRAAALGKAASMLDTVGLGNRLHSLPKQMSGGQQQRVAIARALIHEPRLLVCDEPTAALDARSGHTVMELLRSVAVHPERAVIVVTHDHRVFSFGDRLVHMEDGQIERVERVPRDFSSAPHGEPSDHAPRFSPGTRPNVPGERPASNH